MIAVHAVPTEIDDKLSSFQEKLQVFYCENGVRLSNIKCFDYCVAKYLEDDSWYRAQVISVDANGIKVKFIDYGNCEVIEPKYICELSPEFASDPQFSHKFCLSGFRVENDQSENLKEKMEEYVYSENVIIRLCKYKCSMPNACATNLLYGELDLVEMLLTNNFVSPQYIVNNQLGDRFESTVENIYGDVFYLFPTQFAQKRENLQTCLQEQCDEKVSLDEIDLKSLYSAKINENWSRIFILSINDSSKTACVKSVDYGIEIEVELADVYLLPKDLLHQPLLLHECKIINFEDAPDNIKSKDMEKVSKCVFMCQMEKSYPVKYPLEVQLFEKDTDDNIHSIKASSEVSKTDENSNSKDLDEIPNAESNANKNKLCNVMESFVTDPDEKQSDLLQDNFNLAESETHLLADSKDNMSMTPGCEFDKFTDAENSFTNTSLSNIPSADEIMPVLEDETMDAESGPESIAFSNSNNPEKTSRLDSDCELPSISALSDAGVSAEKFISSSDSSSSKFDPDNVNVPSSSALSDVESSENAMSVPECEFLDTESSTVSEFNSPEKASQLDLDGKSPTSSDFSNNGLDEKFIPVAENEYLDYENTSENIVKSNSNSPEKGLDLEDSKVISGVDLSHVDSAEKIQTFPECEFLDAESASESTALSNSSSPENSSKLNANDHKLSADIDLSDSAESDFVVKASSNVKNVDTEAPLAESEDKPSDNNFSIEDVGGALQDHKVENHMVESGELDNRPKNIVEESEWDERPECDIKQMPEHMNEELLDDDYENSVNHDSCIENENLDSHLDLAPNETEADISTMNSTGDFSIKPFCANSDSTEKSSPDVSAEEFLEQMLGKVDIYVSDIVISNGCVMLSVIPYDLHVKLMSTLGESLLSTYSKKELGFKHCSVSDLCAVYSDGIWFRGKILEIHEDELSILLIDYGITKTVDQSSVVDLEPEHKKIPPYAVECKLASAYCPPEKAEEVKKSIMDLLLNVQDTGKDVSIEIVEKRKPKQVNLYLTGQNVLFRLLSQNLITQKISNVFLNSSKSRAKSSFVNSDSGVIKLYINLVEQLDSLQTLRNSMNSSYPLNTEKASVVESGVYAVLYENTWQRGKAVLSNDVLQLFLVDSGETAPVSELCHLLPEHCLLPSFAIDCQLPDDILITNDVLSVVKENLTDIEFSVDVNMNSESNELAAIITDMELLEKLKNLSSLGQSIENESESS